MGRLEELARVGRSVLKDEEPFDIPMPEAAFPLGWTAEDIVFGIQKWEESVAEFAASFLRECVEEGVTEAGDPFGLAGSFAIDKPEAEAFIREHSYKFAQKVNSDTADMVRAAINEGITEGLTIPQMADRVELAFETGCSEYRANMIAQTEQARANRRAKLMVWRKIGVHKKVWRTSPGACMFCNQFEGNEVLLDEVWALEGEEITAEADGRTYTMNVSGYDTLDIPQLHPWCRCDMAPVFEEGDGEEAPADNALDMILDSAEDLHKVEKVGPVLGPDLFRDMPSVHEIARLLGCWQRGQGLQE